MTVDETTPAAEASGPESVYVVQVQREVVSDLLGEREGFVAWVDIATVSVPPRTKRKGIIGRALAESGVRPEIGGEPLQVRVLDAASAHATPVGAVQPPPTLEIG